MRKIGLATFGIAGVAAALAALGLMAALHFDSPALARVYNEGWTEFSGAGTRAADSVRNVFMDALPNPADGTYEHVTTGNAPTIDVQAALLRRHADAGD